jgi:hypothetical protein
MEDSPICREYERKLRIMASEFNFPYDVCHTAGLIKLQ